MSQPLKIVSFDVGIRNLAMCICSVNPETKEWEIQKWTILDLVRDTKYTCCISNCQKNATLFGDESPYCTAHGKKTGRIKLSAKDCKNPISKKLVELRELGTKLGIEMPEVAKKAVLADLVTTGIKNNGLRPVTRTRADQVDMVDISHALRDELDKTIGLTQNITHVLVENQIGTIATRMRTIQGMIYQYFAIRHPSSVIRTISSSNKLKVEIPFQCTVDTSDYRARKKQSVQIVKDWLQHRKDVLWSAVLHKEKKKDDLADTLLQVVWFIQTCI